MRHKQRGLGMSESIVALFMLTIGIAGVVSVQLKAVDATSNSLKRVEAMNVAKSVVESIRSNPTEITTYESNAGTAAALNATSLQTDCFTAECTTANKAKHDLFIMREHAKKQGLAFRISDCPSNSARKCVLVSWGETNPTVGTGATDCMTTSTAGAIINKDATCVVLESM